MITIISSGPYTSIQDKGRIGYQAYGVPEGGSMDDDARICANWLVGNNADAAGLECYMGGVCFHTDSAICIALTGTALGKVIITGKQGKKTSYDSGQTIHVQPDDTILIPPLPDSNLCFIALSCQFDLPSVYGSYATSLNAQLGGFHGRRLAESDQISIIPHSTVLKQDRHIDMASLFCRPNIVRVVLGPQDYAFTASETEKLLSSEWTLSTKMDRMGIRLNGPQIYHKKSADILSDGIVKGAIQIPGDGQPIIMMADHQTTGGYTKLACIISADLSGLARLSARQKIRFQAITQGEAEKIAIDHCHKRDNMLASNSTE